MDIIIALIALALGLAFGFLVGKALGRKSGDNSSRNNLLMEEREAEFQRILNEQKLSAEKDLQQQKFFSERELQQQKANFENLLNEKETATKNLLNEKENLFNSLLQNKEKSFSDLLKKEEEAHSREKQTLINDHKAALEALEKKYSEWIETLKQQFAETSGRLSQQLKVSTEEMLKQRQEEFASSSKEKLDLILIPLENSLKAMQEKVAENTNKHNQLGGELSQSIKILLNHTESAQASADKLADILKGNNRYQGTWGEQILQEILESLNFKEGIHFETQLTMTDDKGAPVLSDEGKKLRPDIVLHLDRKKDVIIDSKVSLSAYFDYREAQNEAQKEDALKNHIRSIEKHVDELAKKDYAKYVKAGRIRMGYVIMFVPNTSALHLATSNKPTLWREAMDKNVYIADEQTLFAALKIISMTWQQIQQAENHRQLYDLAEEMLKRVATFMKHFTEIGNSLEKATKSYNEGLKKLEERGQSIPRTCRNILKLGAKAPDVPKGVDKELVGIPPAFTPDSATFDVDSDYDREAIS